MIIWRVLERPLLYNPVLIEGLPGIGNVGKIVVEYLIQKLNAKKFAEVYSSSFPYHVFVREDGTVELPKNELYYVKRKEGDLVFLTGDFQSMTPEGHYEISNAVLDFAKKLGVKFVITLGGFGIEDIPKKPRVIGAATSEELVATLKSLGVYVEGRNIGMIVGASGLLLGLGKLKGMDGFCLMGETLARPVFADPRAAKAVIDVLLKYLKLDVDLTELEKKAQELEKAIARAKQMEKEILERLRRQQTGEELSYIG